MFVRLTFCKFIPQTIDEAKRIYNQDIVPIVKAQKGNLNVHMLEPVDKADDYVSITEWATQADADAYHSSGTYKKLVGMLVDFFAAPPVLKIYKTEDILIAAH